MMSASSAVPAPRIVDRDAMTVAGYLERHSHADAPTAIPAQWTRFSYHFGTIPTQVGNAAYGVILSYKDGVFEYLTGVQVANADDLPEGFTYTELSPQQYAVFTHDDHAAAIPKTMQAIWGEWLPTSGHRIAEAPCFERYGEHFNPHTGKGDIEIWMPIVKS